MGQQGLCAAYAPGLLMLPLCGDWAAEVDQGAIQAEGRRRSGYAPGASGAVLSAGAKSTCSSSEGVTLSDPRISASWAPSLMGPLCARWSTMASPLALSIPGISRSSCGLARLIRVLLIGVLHR